MSDRPLDLLVIRARVATLAGAEPLHVMPAAAIGCRDGRIVWVGPMTGLPPMMRQHATRVEDAGDALVTPGLIDCHTHAVFAGTRAHEFDMRLNGASYAEIAAAGGGILSSVKATGEADEDTLVEQSLPRVRALMADGVSTLEIKSGYGLTLESEARMLRAARRIGDELGIEVRSTFLGLHALPPSYKERRTEYVDLVCDEILPALAEQGLVDAVDAFCENIAFTRAETRRVFERAHALDLPVKLHAEQLSDMDGAALVAEFGGLSADHLEHLSDAGVRAMAEAGTVAVLLPGAFYALRDTRQPPIAALREQGVPMAVATDLNPGTAPLLSLRLAANMACTLFRLTPAEALLGVTVNAARALGLDDRGTLEVGKRADLAVWDVHDPAELCYWIGGTLLRRLFVAGKGTDSPG